MTRKITAGVAAIAAGKARELRLGNLEARRDWGHAPDYVEAMWRMVQQDTPEDYVVATGETHSVREFCELAFTLLGLDYRNYVVTDPQLYRPAEVDQLIGNAARARSVLGWDLRTDFETLVRTMVLADCRAHGIEMGRVSGSAGL